jgi:adenylate cyclase
VADPEKEAPLRRNSCAELERLLETMTERPNEQAALAAELDARFGETRAVLVLDMSGFSRATRRGEVVPFLLMIHRMKRLATPLVEANRGVVVKAQADNLYCLFEDVPSAVTAARAIVAGLEAASAALPETRRLYASIGIGFGRILNIDEEDMWGDEVNLACKLGEDIAGRGEILLTQAARAAAPSLAAERLDGSVSGLDLNYFKLE